MTEPVRLVADIGGTNARFALVIGDHGRPQQEATLPTIDYPGIADAIEHYLKRCASPQVLEGAIAIANPITGDWVKMTNHHWAFSIEETRRRLKFTRLMMLNDWEAMALAAPVISPADLTQIGRGHALERAPKALIGPGTGLGVSSLVPTPQGGWVPVAGEGGHVTLAATSEREADIIRVTWAQHEHVSAERLVSGMGLENLYRAVATLDGVAARPLVAADVTRLGLSGEDPQCAEALATFCGFLGNVAGNLALTLGARGGVYIGGGIVLRLGDYLATSPFRAKFEAKGRFAAYLAQIPTFVIRAANPALLGAALGLGVHPTHA